MPLQSIISRDAFNSIDRSAASGNAQARDLVSYFVGQGVGLIDSVKSAGAVVQEFKEDFVEAVQHMNSLVAEWEFFLQFRRGARTVSTHEVKEPYSERRR